MSEWVAVDGMTEVFTSSAKHSADTNQTGSWVNTVFNVTKGTKISVDGDFIEILSNATWSYIGGTVPPSTPVGPFPDSATLTPSITMLREDNGSILLVGDKATGTADSGNYIEVQSGQTKLKTS